MTLYTRRFSPLESDTGYRYLISEDGREITLNDLMDFDHMIRVVGTVIMDGFDSPYMEFSEEDRLSAPEGWSLLTGYTRQDGYRGPSMHASEFIGGDLADHIMSTPGDYMAVMDEDSWAVAYRPPINAPLPSGLPGCDYCGNAAARRNSYKDGSATVYAHPACYARALRER